MLLLLVLHGAKYTIMAIYTGFSTAEVNQPRTVTTTGAYGGSGTTTQSVRIVKKFRLTDEQLIVRDLINALSIKQGDKVGNPSYGTTIWNYMYEPNTEDVRSDMETEIRRVIAEDPRVILNNLNIYPYENGVLFQIEVTFSPFDQPITLSLNLDRNTGAVTQG